MSSEFLSNLHSNHPMLSVHLRDYYVVKYPDDVDMFSLFKNNDATFNDLLNLLRNNKCVYRILPDDSVVRERLFGELSEILNVDYDVIYNAWIEPSDDYGLFSLEEIGVSPENVVGVVA